MEEASFLRLFLGIPLEQSHQNEINKVQADIGALPAGGRWISPANRHVTQFFIGKLAPEQLPNLIALLKLRLQDESSFELQFRDWYLAPRPREARMIWARFHKHPQFQGLHDRLDKVLRPYFSLPQQRFKPIPHLTMARWPAREFDAQHAIVQFPAYAGPDIQVRELVLWQSILHPEGLRYEPLQRFSLSSEKE